MLAHIAYKNGNQETVINIDEVHCGYDVITLSLMDGNKEEIRLSEVSVFKVLPN